MEVQVNIDCHDAEALSQWYCDALGYEPKGSAGQYRSITPRAGTDGPKLIFQEVREPKTAKNRIHLDLIVGDINAAAQRFTDLGAQRVTAEPIQEHGTRWIVFFDPEGNEICLCDS